MTRALSAGTGKTSLSGQVGEFGYSVGGDVLTVSSGAESERYPVVWSFGEGQTGQTWLFQRAGVWQESRVSYFAGLNGLGVTIGQTGATPHGLAEAAGRAVPAAEAKQCFGCHATGDVPGIQCERCHGASAGHLRDPAALPKRLGKLSTEEMSDFCGECHRTWSQISISGPRGVQNVRFQPYRLANSKCYDVADARIRCTACHDPHSALETVAAAYDAKCSACHAACPVGKKDCVTCHMPRIELPGAHRKFTDHRIRVVKANEVYPD